MKPIRVGVDAIMGCGHGVFLPPAFIQFFQDTGRCTLNLFGDHFTTDIWHRGWISAQDLSLDDHHKQVWHTFQTKLHRAHIRLKAVPDDLVWSKKKEGGFYTAKLGYKALQNPDQY